MIADYGHATNLHYYEHIATWSYVSKVILATITQASPNIHTHDTSGNTVKHAPFNHHLKSYISILHYC